jgi:hypothetical protein
VVSYNYLSRIGKTAYISHFLLELGCIIIFLFIVLTKLKQKIQFYIFETSNDIYELKCEREYLIQRLIFNFIKTLEIKNHHLFIHIFKFSFFIYLLFCLFFFTFLHYLFSS